MWKPGACRRAIERLAALLMLLVATTSYGSYESGVAWLLSRQSADGAFYSPETTATPYQATAEAVIALAGAGALDPAGRDAALSFLQRQAPENNEYLARRVLAAVAAGQPAEALAAQLFTATNDDGGLGDAPGYDSAVLNSAFGLSAAAAAGLPPSTPIAYAVGYLLNEQQSGGGWADGPNHPSTYVSALASLALQRYRFQYSVGNAIAAASDFLLASQQPGGGWADVADSALALLALIPVTTDSTRYAVALQRLADAQSANGSWGDDVFATALALRALHLARNAPVPSDPTTGMLTAQVVDQASGLPLAGASVTIQGATNRVETTQPDGRFVAAELLPGNYTVTYAAAGYQGAQQSVALKAGQRIDLGVIRLAVLPTTGLIAGVVTAADTGQPLAGATVAVTGAAPVVTGADGAYAVTAPAGAVEITVSASGYVTINAAGTLPAGSRLSFSPALPPQGSEPPSGEVTVRGLVVDADTSAPLANAIVRSADGSVSASTDAAGAFSLTGLDSGEVTIELHLAGYESVAFRLVTSAGSIADVGTIRLRPAEAITSSVVGSVRDADSGEPVAGATVTAAGISVRADADGRFEINGITSLEFALSAAAPGYLSAAAEVTLQSPGRASIDIPLQRAAIGGIELVSLVPAQPAYPAYSDVRLAATIANESDQARTVRLHARVFDSADNVVDEFAVLVNPVGGEDRLQLPANGIAQAEVSWFNRNLPPASYRLLLQVFDEAGANVLAERAAVIAVLETRRVENARLVALPSYTTQGASEQVDVVLSLRNQSNVDLPIELNYEWLDPDGQVLRSGAGAWTVSPVTGEVTLPVDSFPFAFERSGRYALKVGAASGIAADAVATGFVDAAANIRIELEQSVSPGTVIPDGNKSVRVRIRIEGVEAP